MQLGKSCGFSLGVVRTLNLKSRLGDLRSIVEIDSDADLGKRPPGSAGDRFPVRGWLLELLKPWADVR